MTLPTIVTALQPNLLASALTIGPTMETEKKNYNFIINLSTHITRQECIPVGCVPYARSSSHPGEGLHRAPRRADTPLGADPPGPGTPWEQTPPPDQAPPLWTEFLTHASENITLPQTSFAGGNKYHQS